MDRQRALLEHSEDRFPVRTVDRVFAYAPHDAPG